MTEWEYCHLILYTYRIADSEQTDLEGQGFQVAHSGSGLIAKKGFTFICGSAEPGEPVASLNNAIAGLGREGWEMVSHSHLDQGPDKKAQSFYFKRPLEPEQ